MGVITNASNVWQSRVLASKEMWHCHDGVVYLDTESVEANRLGVRLKPENAIQFDAGMTVYYKLASGTSAIIGYTAVGS